MACGLVSSPSATSGRTPAFSAPVYYQPQPAGSGKLPRFLGGAGQGKAATTLLADQGNFVTVITDVPYLERSRSQPWAERQTKGKRPMHRSTLIIPNQKYTDYATTMQKVHGATRTLEPDEIPHPYPSQHRSQVRFDHRHQSAHLPWHSQYKTIYVPKPTDLPSRLHYPVFENKMRNTEGGDVREMLHVAELPQSYMTQYARVHDKLGVLLGPGVERPATARRQYNILTGEDTGPAWHPENRRVSGNRILYNQYRRDNRDFVLG